MRGRVRDGRGLATHYVWSALLAITERWDGDRLTHEDVDYSDKVDHQGREYPLEPIQVALTPGATGGRAERGGRKE